MTHEEIENITKRLQAIQLPYGPNEILRAFNIAVGTKKCFKDILVELLEQADSKTYMKLPIAYEKLKSENEKLRELADAVKEFVEDTHCEDCPCRRDCDDNNCIFCANDFSYHALATMRKLGIEV